LPDVEKKSTKAESSEVLENRSLATKGGTQKKHEGLAKQLKGEGERGRISEVGANKSKPTTERFIPRAGREARKPKWESKLGQNQIGRSWTTSQTFVHSHGDC